MERDLLELIGLLVLAFCAYAIGHSHGEEYQKRRTASLTHLSDEVKE